MSCVLVSVVASACGRIDFAPVAGADASFTKDGQHETFPSFSPMNWQVLYDGFGAVELVGQSARLRPKAATMPSETHAALAILLETMESPLADFDVSIEVMNTAQLRTPTPNPWEVFWLFTNYVPTDGLEKEANYIIVKPNGIELGAAFGSTEQRFAYTAANPSRKVGQSYVLRALREGARLRVWVDEELAIDYVNDQGILFDHPGTFGIYTEDADVLVTNFHYRPILP